MTAYTVSLFTLYPYPAYRSSYRPSKRPSTRKMSPTKNSEYDHTSEEWEAQRDLFTHHYAVEDRPLREVKEIMETSYGFCAT
jgi:hypothetical protein